VGKKNSEKVGAKGKTRKSSPGNVKENHRQDKKEESVSSESTLIDDEMNRIRQKRTGDNGGGRRIEPTWVPRKKVSVNENRGSPRKKGEKG